MLDLYEQMCALLLYFSLRSTSPLCHCSSHPNNPSLFQSHSFIFNCNCWALNSAWNTAFSQVDNENTTVLSKRPRAQPQNIIVSLWGTLMGSLSTWRWHLILVSEAASKSCTNVKLIQMGGKRQKSCIFNLIIHHADVESTGNCWKCWKRKTYTSENLIYGLSQQQRWLIVTFVCLFYSASLKTACTFHISPHRLLYKA